MKIEVDGVVVSYECAGSGYPIILLHGWGARKETFNKLFLHLAENFMVYVIDLPGFGETEIGLPMSMDSVVDLIYHFNLKLSIDNPILLGHSYGGRLAIIYASKYEVKKLILVASAGLKQKLNFKKKLKVRLYKALKKCGLRIKMGSRDYIDSDNVKRHMLVEAVNTDLTENLKKISAETLLIYGTNDKVTPTKLGRRIKNNINNSILVEMEDCGHFLYLERAMEFQLILDSFIITEAQ